VTGSQPVICTGEHVFTTRIGDRVITARHTVDSDPAALMPCFDYAVIGESGRVVAYVVTDELTKAAPYDVFSADAHMRFLETRPSLAEAVSRGWLESP
jgi:ATP:corrinoid adenosyltransferase